MARSSKADLKARVDFSTVPSEIEDEILLTYTSFTDKSPDIYLHQLGDFFAALKIQECFTRDILQCVDYFYGFMANINTALNESNTNQSITVQMMKAYTITSSAETLEDLIDIVDIDKLIRQCNRLVKFRDNFDHILDTWKLVVSAAADSKDTDLLEYKLTLPGLQTLKNSLKLSSGTNKASGINDAFLIDMLGCCQIDTHGDLVTFDMSKTKDGPAISIKEFAEILGNIGELT